MVTVAGCSAVNKHKGVLGVKGLFELAQRSLDFFQQGINMAVCAQNGAYIVYNSYVFIIVTNGDGRRMGRRRMRKAHSAWCGVPHSTLANVSKRRNASAVVGRSVVGTCNAV